MRVASGLQVFDGAEVIIAAAESPAALGGCGEAESELMHSTRFPVWLRAWLAQAHTKNPPLRNGVWVLAAEV